jgi:hypothetical protein
MTQTCKDIEPYVNGVKQVVTFGFERNDTRAFDFDNGPMSVCRQLFMSLFYQNFKDLVRVSVRQGNIHLTVPSTLDIGLVRDFDRDDDMDSEGSVEYGGVDSAVQDSYVGSVASTVGVERKDTDSDADDSYVGSVASTVRVERKDTDSDAEDSYVGSVASTVIAERKDEPPDHEESEISDISAEQGVVESNEEAEEFKSIAGALMRRVPQFSAAFQLKNLSTTVVLLGACHGILGETPGISLRAYWNEFEDDADATDVNIYIAALHIACLPIPARVLTRYNASPHRYNTFELMLEDMDALPRVGAGWRHLTDAWTLDWLCAYGRAYAEAYHQGHAEARAFVDENDFDVSPCVDFLLQENVSKAMGSKLNFAKSGFVNEMGRHRIYFLTHAVFTMSAYGRSPWLLKHADINGLIETMHGWLLAWHAHFTAKPITIIKECELVCEIGSCLMITCAFLRIDVPANVLFVAKAALRRRTDCPVAKADRACAFAFHHGGIKPEFEDYHTALVLSHESSLLSRLLENS